MINIPREIFFAGLVRLSAREQHHRSIKVVGRSGTIEYLLHIVVMQSIPNELVPLIYDGLHMPVDIINLSMTSLQLYYNMPSEHRRILSILKRYQCINKSIRDIKYYCMALTYAKLSVRILSKSISFTNEVVVCMFPAYVYTNVYFTLRIQRN